MMYLSPPRPLVMITGHVSSVSTVISALAHHTCLTCLASVLHLVPGSPDHCKEVVLARTGSLLTGVRCTAEHSLHCTLLSGPLLYTVNTFCPSIVRRSIHKSFGRKAFALKGIGDADKMSKHKDVKHKNYQCIKKIMISPFIQLKYVDI